MPITVLSAASYEKGREAMLAAARSPCFYESVFQQPGPFSGRQFRNADKPDNRPLTCSKSRFNFKVPKPLPVDVFWNHEKGTTPPSRSPRAAFPLPREVP